MGLLSVEEQAKYTTIESGKNIIILRPFLKEFLDYLFAKHTVSLWTWSDSDYAESIARNIVGKHGKLRLVLSDKDAEASAELHGHSKDLNYIWYENMEECFSECNRILIDDLTNNTIHPSNKHNSITVRPFALFGEVKDRSGAYTPVYNDTTLLDIIELLMKLDINDCYENDDRWEPIFSETNIKKYGIQSYVHIIEYSPFKKLRLPPVKAIGVGIHIIF